MHSETKTQRSKGDLLLGTAKFVIIVMGILIVFATVMHLIGLGALLTVERAELMAKLAAANAPASGYIVIIGFIAMLLVALALVAWFLRLAWQLIASVEIGDPFHEDNADRLRSMGWLTLVIQLLVTGATLIGRWMGTFVEGVDAPLEIGVQGTGFLLPLILFILARIFRLGTQMRADLEGTV
ncbi:MAG: DUF2975 domain-containing protein [Sphingomonas sp.]|nr:DUF2975 domain-containing protein [Sphingomonas sp.]RZV52755.1 MAG: DUF2975 domain-containing protein [Sphingomonadaceae bacterium]